MDDNTSGGFLLISAAALIGLLVLTYVVDKKKLRPSLLQPVQKIVKLVWGIILTIFALFAIAATIDWYVNDSGWLPRTRDIDVYVRTSDWVTGESKMCSSATTKEKGDLHGLACGDQFRESHTLTVKFWGPITTDRDKIWKCKRDESSFTCYLQ
jgi:hypothetical protein